jgi:pimeloyl-ACP methyl ester carboxylesterase
MKTLTKLTLAALTALACSTAAAAPAKGSYATVNGVNMYYEVTGKGRPIVLLHGAFCTIEGCLAKLGELLAKNRQVIAVELQGHGRTADVDGRPLATTTMADDVAALLDKLKIANADIYGYSMGGGVATQLAIRHPRLVGKLVIAGAALTKEGAQPGTAEMIKAIKPEDMEKSPMADAYRKVSPHPEKFKTLVRKIQGLESFDGYKLDDLKKIKAPVLFILGDADYGTVEHGAAMLRLFGGGAFGDLPGQPRAKSQLAILPGTSHIEVVLRADLVAQMATAFLDAK